jgi:4Fe-4S ferredoxin
MGAVFLFTKFKNVLLSFKRCLAGGFCLVGLMEVYSLLPRTNCKECGLSTCMAFAAAFVTREKRTENCHWLSEDKYKPKLAKLMEFEAELDKAGATGLIIHPEKCFGCGNCVTVCPVNVAAEPTRCAVGLGPATDKAILHVEDGVVVCSNPKECRRFGPNKINCNACVVTCPSRAIEFV